MPAELSVISLVHPGAILRGKHEHDPLQVEYLKRAKEYINFQYDPIDLSQLPESANLYPSFDDLVRFTANRDLLKDGLAIDIEAAGRHLICIGITRVSDLAYICCRFRHKRGRLYWPDFRTLYKVIEWLDDLLRDPEIPKGFHNGQAYDVVELEQFTFQQNKWWGFEVNGFWDHSDGWDTMLMQMTAMSGFPKGLQFCATFHLGFPHWKSLVKEDDEMAEGKG